MADLEPPSNKAHIFKYLFLVSIGDLDFGDWEHYSKFVICCISEDVARNTSPRGEYKWYNNKRDTTPWVKQCDISKLIVTMLGPANSEIEEGIICSSFCHES